MKILIMSHGDLCIGMLSSYKMLAGNYNLDNITALSLSDNDTGEFKTSINEFVNQNKDNDILMICDIAHGTPYNEAMELCLNNSKKIAVVSGLNLPMLLEVGLSSVDILEDLADLAVFSGVGSISKLDVSELNVVDDDLDF